MNHGWHGCTRMGRGEGRGIRRRAAPGPKPPASAFHLMRGVSAWVRDESGRVVSGCATKGGVCEWGRDESARALANLPDPCLAVCIRASRGSLLPEAVRDTKDAMALVSLMSFRSFYLTNSSSRSPVLNCKL